MKRYRLPKSFTLNGLIIFVALFCVSTFAFLEHTSISISQFSSLKLPLMYVGFVCLVTQIRTIFRCLLRKNVFYTMLALMLLCVLLVVSMFANRNTSIGQSPLRYTVRVLLYLVEVFLLAIVIAESGRGKAAMSFLFWYLLIIAIVNDTLMFSRIITFGSGRHESYLVGTKFSVSYLHMNLMTLWVIRRQQKGGIRGVSRWAVIVAAIFVALVAIRVDCMTGMLGTIMLALLFVWIEKPIRFMFFKFTSPVLLLLLLTVSVMFSFVADAITQLPLVESFVEDVLNRDTSITGRTNIYRVFIANLEGHWLTGYGYGNGNEAAVTLFGYENVQNGLLQWVLQVGIPATIGMIVLMMQVFQVANRSKLEKKTRFMPVVSLIYVYIILGMIETTYNMTFIMLFALIHMLANEKPRQMALMNPEMRGQE